MVARPHLVDRLNAGLCAGCKLTLIAAPAGFGKTTLVSQWVAGCGRPGAWLSLDEGDNETTRFLAYLCAALQTVAPGIGARVLPALQAPQSPPPEAILTDLLNEIAAVPDDLILVLDDYHAVNAPAIDAALAFLIEHEPPRMHLVIATREDPQLPLARLRARGQLTELRAADLRFTASEAAEFLHRVMGRSLSADDVNTLADRTEGWVAGLQLAALSMHGRQDVSGFIRAFGGGHHYIMDYWRVAMARIREAQGDLDGALELLGEAERLYAGDFFPNVRPVAAFKTRVWVKQGRLGEARDWARARGLSAGDNLSYLREFEHITLARVLLAVYQSDRADRAMFEAAALLQRLLRAAQERGRSGSAIEILVLQALAHHLRGDIPAALAPLRQALALAEPEGYVRTFVDEGPPMAALLGEAEKHGLAPGYVRQLLRAFGAAPEATTPARQDLVEPLSERELEVLRLLETDLTGPEMARQLVVSLNTVHTHTKNIYAKLGVNNRRAAVRRAGEIGLL